MIKKIVLFLGVFVAPMLMLQAEGPSSVCVLKYEGSSCKIRQLSDDWMSRLFFGGSENTRNFVAALITYCITYTLYQTAKGVGSTAWTWWKGEQLSPAMQRQIILAVEAELQRKKVASCTCCEADFVCQ